LNRKVENNAIMLRRKTTLKLPDATIAASALAAGATLVSRDKQLLGLKWPGLTVISTITNHFASTASGEDGGEVV
jgi:hypothetical protein